MLTFALEQATKAQNWSRCTALLLLAPWRWLVVGGQPHVPVALPPGKRPGTNCTGGWVGLRAVSRGAANLAHAGIRSPDRPARNESLYKLSYFGPHFLMLLVK
jgi:hypothetical protein